jgi:hypothetical protein
MGRTLRAEHEKSEGMKRKIVLAVLIYLCLGFLSERAKVSLNFYLEQGDRIEGFYAFAPDRRDAALDALSSRVPYDYYYNHGRVKFYHRMTRSQLIACKWGLAIGLVGVYMLLARGFMSWFNQNDAVLPIYILTLTALLLSLVFFVVMILLSNPQPAYAVARKLLGFAQSPLPVLLALLSRRLRSH